MINYKNNSHYVYIKDFNKFIFNKTKRKNKKRFCRYCLQCFSSERDLVEHEEICLEINGKQVIKSKGGKIKFRNYSEQLVAPFKIYADFECNVKGVKSSDENNYGSHTKKNQEHIPCSFSYKLVCIDDNFSNPVVLYREKKI